MPMPKRYQGIQRSFYCGSNEFSLLIKRYLSIPDTSKRQIESDSVGWYLFIPKKIYCLLFTLMRIAKGICVFQSWMKLRTPNMVVYCSAWSRFNICWFFIGSEWLKKLFLGLLFLDSMKYLTRYDVFYFSCYAHHTPIYSGQRYR